MTPAKSSFNILAMGLLLAVAVSGQESAKSPVRGRLLLPGGGPLAGAVVTVQKRVPNITPATQRKEGSATTSNGDFETSGVEEGEYDLCVGVDPHLGVLDPCEWPGEAKRLNVSAANRSATMIQLATGPRLKFVLEDRGRLLRHPREPVGFLPSALIGAFDAAGFFHVARMVSADQGVFTYILPVPRGTEYTVHVSAPGLKFAEGGGAAKTTVSNPLAVTATERRDEIVTTLVVQK